MRTCLALLLFALAATTAHAASWSPFVGVGGHAGVVGSYSHGDWPQRWDGTYRGYGASGGMIEAGLATERVDLYVAYRHSEAKSYAFENRVSSYWNEGSFVSMSRSHEIRRWTDNRIFLGGRWHAAAPGQRLRPLVGAALSAGQPVRTRITYTETYENTTPNEWFGSEQTQKQTSDLPYFLPGLLLEFGFALRAAPDFDLNLTASVAAAPVRFSYSSYEMESYYDWHTLLSPAFNLTARYTLTPLRLGH